MPRPAAARSRGDAARAQAVGPVRRHGDVDDRIVEAEGPGEGLAHGRILGQLDDAGMVLAEPHLALGAQHAVAVLAADARLFQHHAGAGEGSAGRGEHALHPSPSVGRAAHDLNGARARIDGAQGQLVGVGVGMRINDAGDGEGVEVASTVDDLLDLEAELGEAVDDLAHAGTRLQVLREPRQGELHRPSPWDSVGTSRARKP